jgi:hypothetical protein
MSNFCSNVDISHLDLRKIESMPEYLRPNVYSPPAMVLDKRRMIIKNAQGSRVSNIVTKYETIGASPRDTPSNTPGNTPSPRSPKGDNSSTSSESSNVKALISKFSPPVTPDNSPRIDEDSGVPSIIVQQVDEIPRGRSSLRRFVVSRNHRSESPKSKSSIKK